MHLSFPNSAPESLHLQAAALLKGTYIAPNSYFLHALGIQTLDRAEAYYYFNYSPCQHLSCHCMYSAALWKPLGQLLQ